MFLKKLTENGFITVDYYQNGLLQSCKGRVYSLNLNKQLLSLQDHDQKIFYIHLSGIKEIH